MSESDTPAEGQRQTVHLPPEILESLARGLSIGIAFTMDRTLNPSKITSIQLTDANPPNPLAEAIKAKVADGVDLPLIIDGQWFIIRRTRPVPLA